VKSNKPDKRRVLAVTLAAAAALATAAGAAHAQAPALKTQAKPVIRSVDVKTATATQRVVTVATAGRRFQHVVVCDLQASSCVSADHVRRNRWRGLLPSRDPAGPYRIGVIARSGRDYASASVGNAEAPPPFMP
jgi:hypothetical protein